MNRQLHRDYYRYKLSSIRVCISGSGVICIIAKCAVFLVYVDGKKTIVSRYLKSIAARGVQKL